MKSAASSTLSCGMTGMKAGSRSHRGCDERRGGRNLRPAPRGRSRRDLGEKNIGSQPSAISAVSATFFGPSAPRKIGMSSRSGCTATSTPSQGRYLRVGSGKNSPSWVTGTSRLRMARMTSCTHGCGPAGLGYAWARTNLRRPAARCAEAIRAILKRDVPVTHEGEFFPLPTPEVPALGRR